MKPKKSVYLEFLRIIAIFLVLFNHTGDNGFFLFANEVNQLLYYLYMFISIGCKIAVPLFFMISGAVLLGKEESIADVFKKRIFKMAVVLLAISLFYALFEHFVSRKQWGIYDFCWTLYCSEVADHLWYLYVYIGIITMLPLLRKLAKNMSVHEYIYLAAMSLLLIGIIPILQYRFTLDEFQINRKLYGALFATSEIVYFLMGYFFENVVPKKWYTLKNVIIGFALGIFSIAISCYMTNYKVNITGECNAAVSQTFHNVLIAIPTYSVFFAAKYFSMRKEVKEKSRKIIVTLGSLTFGVYLFDYFCRYNTFFVFQFFDAYMPTLFACLIWVFAACSLGALITYFLKKIPIVNRII